MAKTTKKTEEEIPEVVEVAKAPKVKEDAQLSEVDFLKRIYTIQNEGGFGKHLNAELEERINQLEKK